MIVFFNQILPKTDMLAGGERIVIEILRNQHPLTVILPSRKAWLVVKELRANYCFLKLPFNSANKILIFFNWVVLAVKSCKFRTKEEVITSNDFFCNTIPAFFLGRWTAYMFHIIPRKRLFSYLLQQFSFLLMRRADKVIVFNKVVRDYLLDKGFSRVFIQEVDIDEEAIKKVKKQTKIYEACFLGRLSPSKGIYDLPKIWQGMEGKLLVIGNGLTEDVKRLKWFCKHRNIGKNIIFAGYKEGEEKFRLIKQSKVFIFPSYEEGLSLTIKEVLACGLPIIAWDLPVYKDLYEGKLFTVPIGDIEKFREEIYACLNNRL